MESNNDNPITGSSALDAKQDEETNQLQVEEQTKEKQNEDNIEEIERKETERDDDLKDLNTSDESSYEQYMTDSTYDDDQADSVDVAGVTSTTTHNDEAGHEEAVATTTKHKCTRSRAAISRKKRKYTFETLEEQLKESNRKLKDLKATNEKLREEIYNLLEKHKMLEPPVATVSAKNNEKPTLSENDGDGSINVFAYVTDGSSSSVASTFQSSDYQALQESAEQLSSCRLKNQELLSNILALLQQHQMFQDIPGLRMSSMQPQQPNSLQIESQNESLHHQASSEQQDADHPHQTSICPQQQQGEQQNQQKEKEKTHDK